MNAPVLARQKDAALKGRRYAEREFIEQGPLDGAEVSLGSK